ncbi:MAG: tryptophan 2,3-dioxygenase [Myxococcales bacterium]|nr:tryptophan 2,3-dioxygenase [Myxococcales bacterium]
MKLKFEIGAGKTDYEKYLRTTELLSLQKSQAERSCPDELQFQVVHQIEELWMKLVLSELERVEVALNADEFLTATLLLRRIQEVERLMVNNLALLDTMSPLEYQKIRMGLGNGSGMESPGFNWILNYSPALGTVFDRVLARSGVTVDEIYRSPDTHQQLYMVAEGLCEHDQQFHRFLYHHWLLIQRIIGGHVLSLKGVEANQVMVRVMQRFYPELWSVRERMTNEWNEKRGLTKPTEHG